MAKEFARGFYRSKAWRNGREVVIARSHGLCERCLRKGELTPGHIVHHKIALTPENIDDPTVSLDPSLLEYVCKECHEEIHAEMEEGALNGRLPDRPRVAFDADGNVVKIPTKRR